MLKQWLKAGQIYFDRRMLVMTGLGFASGFPLLLVFSTLNLWLKDSGVSYALIGIFSLVKTPYSFKWVWAPFIDRIKLPLFSKMGRRRGWALFAQIILMLAIMGMSFVDPKENPMMIAALAVLVVFASATQDIVLDAYRIESFNNKEQAAGSAIFVLGYRFGLIFSGAGALWLASIMSWHNVYMLMALGSLVGMFTIICSKEPEKEKKYKKKEAKNFREFIKSTISEPFKDFTKRPNWTLILLFIFLYRMSDAYMGPMAYPFYDDMGFSKGQIAYVSKIYGMIATIVGGIVGGVVLNRIGIMKGLMFCGILQGLSNLMFVAQAYAGNDVRFLMMTISLDNIAGGMATTALVAYLSSLCNIAYTATQYALLSSLMSLARDLFASTSGYMVEAVSWQTFFYITTLMMVPGLALLWYLMKLEVRKILLEKPDEK